jgi:hypothetical protein
MTRTNVIRLDRSRMGAYQNCPRLRYLTYHARGTGLSPVGTSLALTLGSAFHAITAALRLGQSPAVVIAAAAAEFRAALLATPRLDGDEVAPWVIDEQVRLLEGMAWAWVRTRLPAIQAEFDVVAIEHELLWELAPGIEVMVRGDALERRRADALLFYREFKTTSSGDGEWAKQFDTNSQILSNVLAFQEVLHEDISGVIIEGVIKGRRALDRAKASPFNGLRLQQSAFCYGYRYPGDRYLTEWARGATKVRSWEVTDARTWVYEVMDEAECASQFSVVPPILPRPDTLARWRRQMLAQESHIARALETLALPGFSSIEALALVRQDILDAVFPLNDDHCHRYFGYPCPYKDVCFDPVIGRDPLGSGLYVRRVPHHTTEVTAPLDIP